MCTPACRAHVDPTGQGIPLSPEHWAGEPFEALRQDVKVVHDGVEYEGKLVANSAHDKKRPLVIVIHNFCGRVQWHEHVAEYMARLGYVGLAVDFYGPALIPHEIRGLPQTPEEAEQNIKDIFSKGMIPMEANMPLMLAIFQKWIDVGCAHPAVDPVCKPAAIGYCLGGLFCIDAIRAGLQLGGVVSFHGVLHYQQQPTEFIDFVSSFMTLPQHIAAPLSYNTTAPCLIENGEHDGYGKSPLREVFEKEMADAGVKLRWHELKGADHGFALAPCVWGGSKEYHKEADRQSTLNMLHMFQEIWPDVEQQHVCKNAAGAIIIERPPM